jgi:hypothetical protein
MLSSWVLIVSAGMIVASGVSASAQERSFLCQFTSGPRAGQVHDYAGHPAGALPVGSPCQDGAGSNGVIVPSGAGGTPGGGYPTGAAGQGIGAAASPCRNPVSKKDCDKCGSDASYERCLEKLDEDE